VSLFGAGAAFAGLAIITVVRLKSRDLQVDSCGAVLWAEHYTAVEVEAECCLGEPITVSGCPWFGQDALPGFESVVGPTTREIPAIDVQLRNVPVDFNLGAKNVSGVMLGLVCGSNCRWTAAASDFRSYAWSNVTIASNAGGLGGVPRGMSEYIAASSS
jgi:hypothetical protein